MNTKAFLTKDILDDTCYNKDEINNIVESLDEQKSDKIEYSLGEVDTGNKWIDGKKIYRYILAVTGPNATSVKYTLPFTALSLIKVYGYIKSSTNFIMNINQPRPDGYTNGISCYIDSPGNILTLMAGANRTTMSGYAIIEYTKEE